MRSAAALVVALITALVFCSQASGQACYETQIKSPSPYLGNGGEIIVMMDGTVWTEVSYQYLYLYEYYPTVTICPSRGIMLLNGKRFSIVPVGGQLRRGQAAPTDGGVIESSISGTFNGWTGETIFKLANGQIWEQAEYAYLYHYAYSPSVLIVNRGGQYVMQVEGVDERIAVRRLR